VTAARRGVLLLGTAFLSCVGAGRLELAELPEAPVAVVHRKPEEARRRAESIQAKRSQGSVDLGGAGVLDLNELRRRLFREDGDDESGRLALVRRGTVAPIPSAPRGAVPLDWSPDGRALLMSAPRSDRKQLFALRVEDGELRPLTHGPDAHPMGCYLADGRLVAVRHAGRGARARARLVVGAAGGGEVRELTSGPFDADPACAPHGSRVAFVTWQAGQGSLVATLDVAEEEGMRVVGRGLDPTFSPDGGWVVYSARTARGQRLWRVRPDGSGKLALGEGRTEERQPAVSPDGRFVAYVSVEDDRERLRVRRFDGSADRLLIEGGDAAAPVW
jgi:Tol biopolymer transport system component